MCDIRAEFVLSYAPYEGEIYTENDDTAIGRYCSGHMLVMIKSATAIVVRNLNYEAGFICEDREDKTNLPHMPAGMYCQNCRDDKHNTGCVQCECWCSKPIKLLEYPPDAQLACDNNCAEATKSNRHVHWWELCSADGCRISLIRHTVERPYPHRFKISDSGIRI